MNKQVFEVNICCALLTLMFINFSCHSQAFGSRDKLQEQRAVYTETEKDMWNLGREVMGPSYLPQLHQVELFTHFHFQ